MALYEKARRLEALAFNKMGIADVEELGRNLAIERGQVHELMGHTENRRELMEMYRDIEQVRLLLLSVLERKGNKMIEIAQAYLYG